MSRTALPAAVFVASAVLLSGCLGGSVRSATRNAVPIVVDETLTSFEDPRNRERFEQIIASPEMQGAIQATARGLVTGALGPGANVSVETVTDSMADLLARDIRDRILPATVAGLRDSLSKALTPEDESAILKYVDTAVARATAAAVRSASAELPTSLAPAMRTALVESLNSPDLDNAVARVTADATRTALLSSRDVIVELQQQREGEGPVVQLVDRVQRMLERVVLFAFLGGAVLGSVLVWASRFVRRRGPSEPTGPMRLDRPSTRAT